MATPPALGYGQRAEAPIDSVNQWMRGQPWYQALLQSFGQNPNNVHLNDQQKQQVIKAAQANGVVVDEGHNGQEVDDSGNFQAKSHALRNTLIVAGVAAAALATAGAAGAFAGGAAAASGGGAAAGGGALASSATVPTIGALAAGGSGLAAGTGATVAGTAGATALGGGAMAGLSYGDLLKYGLPVAGNLVGGLIQAKASTAANDAQQKYLEEALAYEKEKDQYQRGVDAAAVTKEASRYGDYTGRIAPFIANGTNSNDRMAALLGLPARAGGGGVSSGPPASQRVPIDPGTQAAIRAELQRTNSSDDPAAWDEYLSSHGDSSVKNWDYWKGRIDTGDGVGKGYAGAPVAAQSAPAAQVTTQPQARAAVQMRAPDGSVKAIPADQVQFYQSKGATVLQGAA